MLAQVAELYYERQQNQQQIAQKINCSRSMVSRYLNEAREAGVVEIRINHIIKRRQDMEAALKARYGLREVRVLAHMDGDYQKLVHRLGVMAAELLPDLVSDGMTVGVSWGATLADMIASMRLTPRQKVRVVQVLGSLGADNPDFDGPELARKLALSFGAEYATLPAPLFVDTPQTRDLFVNNARIKEALAYARKMDVLVAGIGTVDRETSTQLRGAFISPEQHNQLIARGAVGDYCAYHFNLDGRLADSGFARRTIGIDPESIKAVPTRLGVGGGPTKAQSVLGALRGKLVNVLVTDEAAASMALR